MSNNNTKYVVKDSQGEPKRVFFSLKYAEVYKETSGREDWTIEKLK